MMKIVEMTKQHASKVGVGALALVGSTAAMASTAPASQGASAISELQAQATELITAAWPVAIAIVGGLIGIKLFKKFANSVT